MFNLKKDVDFILELRPYTQKELAHLLHTADNQGIKRKLDNYKISYTAAGRGSKATFCIQEIPDAFKVLCIIELDIPAQSDFNLLRNFFYYFFNDDNFRVLPVAEMADRMTSEGKSISRQTIEKWLKFLEGKNLISRTNTEYTYYKSKIVNNERILTEITKEEHADAWQKYWKDINDGNSQRQAFHKMYSSIDGKPFRVPVPENNAIYTDLIASLSELAADSFEKEYGCP